MYLIHYTFLHIISILNVILSIKYIYVFIELFLVYIIKITKSIL